jgi:hypothetical protein
VLKSVAMCGWVACTEQMITYIDSETWEGVPVVNTQEVKDIYAIKREEQFAAQEPKKKKSGEIN